MSSSIGAHTKLYSDNNAVTPRAQVKIIDVTYTIQKNEQGSATYVEATDCKTGVEQRPCTALRQVSIERY
jgi:hypothetical protein